jgi:hypothetical protein
LPEGIWQVTPRSHAGHSRVTVRSRVRHAFLLRQVGGRYDGARFAGFTDPQGSREFREFR